MKTKPLAIFGMLFFAPIAAIFSQNIYFTENGTWVNAGDADVPGNQMTIEALIFIDGTNPTMDVVSKHNSPDSANYILRPNSFEFTTYVAGNAGPVDYEQLKHLYPIDQNTWYHLAGTYDGATARFYVNGCVVAETPHAGNLCQNDLLTAIGNLSDCQCEQFYGNIDEVRIWATARTAAQISANMLDLPNPAAQPGLVAYFKFDNSLANLQGNPALDGALVGNVQFVPGQADVEAFHINAVQAQNAYCQNVPNGAISFSTNRPGSLFSINGTDFQANGAFTGLSAGSLTVFAQSPEGCITDSTISIGNDFIYQKSTLSATVCQGETFLGYGAMGIFVDTLPAQLGCDTIRTLMLTVLPNPTQSVIATICAGETFEGYASTGIFRDTFPAANGCDSVRTLNLTVLPVFSTSKTAAICAGESMDGYSLGGVFVDLFQAANGCDSTRTLALTVHPVAATDFVKKICEGSSFEGYTVSGTYTDTMQTVFGCDSVRTLTLEVGNQVFVSVSKTACFGEIFDFNGLQLSAPGIYEDTVQTSSGCDSIITLDLQIAPNLPFLGPDTAICGGLSQEIRAGFDDVTWFDGLTSGSRTVSVSGTYWAVYTDALGCETVDSIQVAFVGQPFVPNAFIANGDGENDCFAPFFAPIVFKKYGFRIFSRWGELIFDTDDPAACWDGKYRGKDCPPGVYVYFLDFETVGCGRATEKGSVTLLK